MIGKIYKSYMSYKDKGLLKYKSRPVMILAEPTGVDTEFTVLPVSTMLNKRYYSHDYDTEINPIKYDLLKLNKISHMFVRTKQQCCITV